MPSYEYLKCPTCGGEQHTRFQISIAKRDEQFCDAEARPETGLAHPCGTKLQRIEIPEPADLIIDTKGSYESAVILKSGQKVAGEFGRMPGNRRGFNQRKKS